MRYLETESWDDVLAKRRLKRCFHRVISGFERGGELRLVTLTSSNDAPWDIQRSFRKLIMRLRRRGLLKDYIKVYELTKAGNEHIHMCFRGKFIDQKYLSALWQEIHKSPVVDIRKVRTRKQDKTRVSSYLAKYMAKEGARRYAWSWGWVYKGFVRTWALAKRTVRAGLTESQIGQGFWQLLKLWRAHLKANSPPDDFLAFLRYQCQILAHQRLRALYPLKP